MIRKAALLFAVAGLALASAKSYSVTLFQDATFGTTELKPGQYKLEVNDTTATIHQGKLQGEAPVKIEEGEQKFNTTSVRYDTSGAKPRIQEIRIGGTKTKLVFNM